MTLLEGHDAQIITADILVVDDQAANLKLLSEILTGKGYHVRPANSPRLAIESALDNPPDLMLLDVKMPDLNGYEVCELFKRDERTRDIPILFISALQDTRSKVRGFEVGGVDFISKPFQQEEVLARVQTHLRLRNLQRNLERVVTERTAELTESENLARTLLNGTTNLTHLLDEDGTILDLNDAMAKALGKPREELIGTCVFDRFSPEVTEERRSIIRQVLAGGKSIRYEDHTTAGRVFDSHISPIETPIGEKGKVVVFAHDITKAKAAEVELQKSHDYFKHLIDSIPDAVFSVEFPERTIRWANDSYSVLGYDISEYIGKKTDQFHESEEGYNALGELLENAIQENKAAFITEVMLRKANGEAIPVELNIAIYRNKGKPVSITALARDISKRRKAQEALEKSEARLREAERIAQVGNWELDLSTNTLFWSDEIFRIFEISKKHFTATYAAFLELVYPEDREMVNKAYRQSLENQSSYSIDHRVLLPDGRVKHVHEQCETTYSPDGTPLRSFGTLQDITERIQLGKALSENEEKLRNAQKLAQLGYWELDLTTNAITWSDEMYKIYGLRRGSVATFDNLLDPVHPGDRENCKQLLTDLIGGKNVSSFTYRIVRQDNSTRYIYGVGLLEYDEHGVPLKLKGTLQDVTELKTVEMAYRDSEARLKQVQTESLNLRLEMAHLNRIMTMNELAASFAHEINQPLGAIVNNVTVAKTLNALSVEEREDINEILDDIAQDAQRAGLIIRKIRGIMKKGDAVYTSLDVNRLLDEVIALYQNSFSLEHVSVEMEKDPDLAPVKGDNLRLQQVLMNLITNAMDAMANSPQKLFTFKTSQSEEMVKVSVSDMGSGIKMSDIDQIFDPFYTTRADGMGIGLRLCKSIIEEHGGRIWAENNPDGGTTFYFTLKAFSEGNDHECA